MGREVAALRPHWLTAARRPVRAEAPHGEDSPGHASVPQGSVVWALRPFAELARARVRLLPAGKYRSSGNGRALAGWRLLDYDRDSTAWLSIS